MDSKAEVREFLTTRRARLSPDAAGLPAYGGRRRVAGLRREEVAMLAGVSVDYYVRLERGDLTGASQSVLSGLARALHLDDAEHEHLFDLARRAKGGPVPRGRRPAELRVRGAVRLVLDAIDAAPAWVCNARHDLLAANRLGRALLAPMLAEPQRPANFARFIFLDPAARQFYGNWARAADDSAAYLRSQVARNEHDEELTHLIDELTALSEDFRTRWREHTVRFHRSGTKRLNHPVVGDLHVNFESMELPSDPGLALVVYTVEPDSPTADALRLLASWAATQDRLGAAPSTGAAPANGE